MYYYLIVLIGKNISLKNILWFVSHNSGGKEFWYSGSTGWFDFDLKMRIRPLKVKWETIYCVTHHFCFFSSSSSDSLDLPSPYEDSSHEPFFSSGDNSDSKCMFCNLPPMVIILNS